MTLRPWDELQLKFDLPGLDEAEEDAVERAITPEQARQISAAARMVFETTENTENTEKPKWFEDYLMLMGQGWPWRVATYIAWASAPMNDRWPSTLEELATTVLGLRSPRVIYHWRRKYPSIDAVIGMMQGAVLFERRRDVLEALADMAARTDYKSHRDRKLYLEMIGDYTPKRTLDVRDLRKGEDLTALSDEELLKWRGDEVETDPGDGEDEGDGSNSDGD